LAGIYLLDHKANLRARILSDVKIMNRAPEQAYWGASSQLNPEMPKNAFSKSCHRQPYLSIQPTFPKRPAVGGQIAPVLRTGQSRLDFAHA